MTVKSGLVCIICACISFMSFADNIFVSESSSYEAVELFEFDSPAQRQRAIKLAKELRCPQCQNQNLLESNSPLALELRLVVYEKVKAGESDQQIITFMTDRYGEFVLYMPKLSVATLLLWLVPLLGVALGAGFIYKLLKRA